MTEVALSVAGHARSASAWRRHGGALALACVAMLALFRSDALHMGRIWWESSTFGHCLLIGPIVAWLVWTRRSELSGLTPQAWWPGLAVVAIGGSAWLAGDAGSVAFARQLGLVVMMQGAAVTLLGPQVARGLAFPLAYALFLVPFGEWMEAPLQGVTVRIVMPLLDLAGVPATSDGVLIHAGRYHFEVAEECSGARFVLAMLALGVLVAQLGFAGWRRRAVFLAACLLVPIAANGLRAFATIWIANLTSVETATGFDHVVWGWVFFALVVAALMGGAWRWFDKPADAAAFDPATLPVVRKGVVSLPVGIALVIMMAVAFPAWSALLASRPAAKPVLRAPTVAGWRRVPGRSDWRPSYPQADAWLAARYIDRRGRIVDLAAAGYARQAQGMELVGAGLGVLQAEGRWIRVADLPPIDGASALRIAAPGPRERVVATWYRVGTRETSDPATVKLLTLKARLLGGDTRAVAMHLSAEGSGSEEAVRDFRAAAF